MSNGQQLHKKGVDVAVEAATCIRTAAAQCGLSALRSGSGPVQCNDQIYNSPLNFTLPFAWADGGLPRCVRGVLLVEGLEEGSPRGLVIVAFGPHGGHLIEIRVREACQEVLPSCDGWRASRVLDLEGQTVAVAVVAAPNVHAEQALGEWHDANVGLQWRCRRRGLQSLQRSGLVPGMWIVRAGGGIRGVNETRSLDYEQGL